VSGKKVKRRMTEVKSEPLCLSMSFDACEMLRVNLAIEAKLSFLQRKVSGPILITYPWAPGQLLAYVLSAFEASSNPDGKNRLMDVKLDRS
jgi:hypothetical protein